MTGKWRKKYIVQVSTITFQSNESASNALLRVWQLGEKTGHYVVFIFELSFCTASQTSNAHPQAPSCQNSVAGTLMAPRSHGATDQMAPRLCCQSVGTSRDLLYLYTNYCSNTLHTPQYIIPFHH